MPTTAGCVGPLIDDPETASRLVSNAYLPIRVRPDDTRAPFSMRLADLQMGRTTAGLIALGSAARLTSAVAEHVHLNVTLRGRSVWSGHEVGPIVTGPGEGVIYNTGDAGDMRSSGCDQVSIMIPRRVLEAELEALTGRSLPKPLVLAPAVSLRGGLSRLLLPALGLVVGEIHRADTAARSATTRHVARHVEGLLVDGLLLGHEHNHSELLHRDQAPGPTARAVELLEEQPEIPWTTVGLARAVNLSVRALQEGFRTAHGTTPTAYLRKVRLRHVHEVLVAAEPGTVLVQDVALRLGILHQGRFSRSYRETYGELPSLTLAREPR